MGDERTGMGVDEFLAKRREVAQAAALDPASDARDIPAAPARPPAVAVSDERVVLAGSGGYPPSYTLPAEEAAGEVAGVMAPMLAPPQRRLDGRLHPDCADLFRKTAQDMQAELAVCALPWGASLLFLLFVVTEVDAEARNALWLRVVRALVRSAGPRGDGDEARCVPGHSVRISLTGVNDWWATNTAVAVDVACWTPPSRAAALAALPDFLQAAHCFTPDGRVEHVATDLARFAFASGCAVLDPSGFIPIPLMGTAQDLISFLRWVTRLGFMAITPGLDLSELFATARADTLMCVDGKDRVYAHWLCHRFDGSAAPPPPGGPLFLMRFEADGSPKFEDCCELSFHEQPTLMEIVSFSSAGDAAALLAAVAAAASRPGEVAALNSEFAAAQARRLEALAAADQRERRAAFLAAPAHGGPAPLVAAAAWTALCRPHPALQDKPGLGFVFAE